MKNKLLLIFLFFNILVFAQDYELRITPYLESEIIFKDGTSIKGLVKLNNSAFEVKYKKSVDEKSIKIDYKNIDKLITNPETENTRTFQYLKNHENKFLKFVELVYSDEISVYISIKDRVNHFYSDFDRSTIKEKMDEMRYFHYDRRKLNKVDSINLPNGEVMVIPMRYNYLFESNYAFAEMKIVIIHYYLLLEGEVKLIPVVSYKKFKKKYLNLFEGCPLFVENFKEKEIELNDLPKFIESYKNLCSETITE